MTTYTQPASCLSPETLALMAAGKLPEAARAQAEAHLATCADCYDVLMELAETAGARPTGAALAGATRGEAAQTRRREPKSIIVWSSIAATVLLAAFIAPRFLGGPDRELNKAVDTLATSVGADRPAVGRLNGGFAWGTPPAITRGAGTKELPLAVQEAILAVKKLAAATRTVKTMDALGVAQLVNGDLDASLVALDAAVALDPKDAAARADLAAARFEKWRRTQAPIDATAALDAAQYALLISPKDPIARFNHALAVEAIGLTQAAIDSWKAYLELDATSKWADEARAHLAKLGAGSAGELPADTGRDRYLPDLAAALAADKTPRHLDCVARGRQAIVDSRAAFDASRTAESEQLAEAARDAFSCGGVPTFEADAQIVWTRYFLGRITDSPALAALANDAERHGYLRAAGRVWYARGRLAGNAARYSDAEEFFENAIGAFRAAGDAEMIASASIQLSEVANFTGNAVASWARLAAAMNAMPQLAPRRQHMTLEGAYLAADRFGLDGASHFFAGALVEADERNATDPVLLAGAYLESARSAFRLADADGALRRLELATTTAAKIGDQALRSQYAAEIDESKGTVLVNRDAKAAIQALSSSMTGFSRAGRRLRLARLLLIRGRAYRAAGDTAAAEKDWSDGAAIFEDQRPDIRDSQERISHFDQMWDLFRELIAVRASNAVASLEVAERFRGRALLDSLSRDRRAVPLSGESMYRWLPQGVTVIAYAVLPERLLRWTISRTGVTLEPLEISASDLTALVDSHRAVLASRGSEFDASAARLSRLLLPAALNSQTSARVVFLPDGPLFGVPFAALPVPGAPAHLVVDDFIVSVAPSLTILKSVARISARPRALLVSAGGANAAESLPALPGAVAEINAIAPAYPNRTRLEGPSATPSAILKALARADVTHFAGHAIADSETPSRSRLLVFGPAAISFDDLRQTPLRPGAIIVLSACDAARGRVFHGEGAVGMTYPFLANGASAVVASIWQIDDATPMSLWQSFHARVSAGAAPDAALAESQRLSRRQGIAPAVWAAFESVGGLTGQ